MQRAAALAARASELVEELLVGADDDAGVGLGEPVQGGLGLAACLVARVSWCVIDRGTDPPAGFGGRPITLQ